MRDALNEKYTETDYAEKTKVAGTGIIFPLMTVTGAWHAPVICR